MYHMTAQMILELKGAKLAVLILLNLCPGVDQRFIQRYTGYTDKPVSEALQYLAETNRIYKSSGAWYLQQGEQLPLEIGNQSRNNSDSMIIESDGVGIIPTRPVENMCKSRNYSDSDPDNPAKVGIIPTLSRNNSDFININDSVNRGDPREELILIESENLRLEDDETGPAREALAALGIGLNQNTECLLALSPAEIEAGHRAASKRGHGRNPGYLITVLKGMLSTRSHRESKSNYTDWES